MAKLIPMTLPSLFKKRTAGPSRGGLGIIDNLVGQYSAYVPLGRGRSDQIAAREFVHHLLRITFGCSHDGPQPRHRVDTEKLQKAVAKEFAAKRDKKTIRQKGRKTAA